MRGLGFEQSYDKAKYFWLVFRLLSHYCSSWPSYKSKVRQGVVNKNTLYMQTRVLPCFTELHVLFYKDKKKIIPDNIYDLLTPVALAHWVMGDGQVRTNGLRLCTDSFTFSEVVKLMNVLIIKYRINCSMHIYRGKPRIYIPAYYISLLTSIVKPHMSSDMYYKLEPGKKKPNVEITHTCGGSLHSITMPQVKSDSSVLATFKKEPFRRPVA